MTDAHAGHAHSHFALGASLLDEGERFSLGLRLSLALACAGLLLLALGLLIVAPQQAELAHLIAGIAALIVAVPVFTEAIAGLRTPTLHAITDQLVAVAVLAAWVVGDLESAALVPLFMVIGHILEERSLLGSQEAIAALARLTRTKARKLVNGAVIEVEAGELHPGDRLEVRPGDRLAADGVVRLGVSSVDNASLTGESVPIEVASGDAVLAGAINLGGRLDVEVTRTGADTTLGKVVSLMRAAERAKPPVTRLLERHAGHYLFFVLLLAAATWFVTSSATAMMTVLVAACPCALVLAAPATAIAAIAVAGRFGILVKGTAFLEELAEVDALVIDKTGTVTIGELRLVELLHGVEHAAAVVARVTVGIREKMHRVAAAAELDALINTGQKARAPQARACAGERSGEHDDIGGEVAVFRAESVGDPRAEARPAAAPEAGVEKHLRRGVVEFLGVQRAHDGDFVGHAREVRQQFGDQLAALAARLKFKARAEQARMAADEGEAFARDERVRTELTVEFLQFGFRIEQVELRRRADHVEVDDVFGAGRKMRRARG